MNEQNKTAVTEDLKPATLKRMPNLKALREARGMTIEDIFLSTRVNTAILNAIENGDFYLLPAPVYAEKFIKLYAENIGTDAAIILTNYQRYMAEKQAVPEEARAVKAQITFDSKPPKRYLMYVVATVSIIATVFIAYYLFYDQQPWISQHKVTGEEQKQVVLPTAPSVEELPKEAVNDVLQTTPPPETIQKETQPAPNNAPLNLLIEATEKTWLRIAEDRKHPDQIILDKGEKLSRTAQDFFIIDVGNAAGVNITFQGKSLGNLGRNGQVVHLQLPPQ